MDSLNETVATPNHIEINSTGINYLKEMRKWTMFISIIGFIGMGLLFIAGIVVLFASGIIPDNDFNSLSFIPLMIIAIIYFFPIYFLYQFSTLSKNALDYHDSGTFSVSVKYLKMHFKFIGVFLIVILFLYLVIGIFALLGLTIFKSTFETSI
jgi:hypothetical protein